MKLCYAERLSTDVFWHRLMAEKFIYQDFASLLSVLLCWKHAKTFVQSYPFASKLLKKKNKNILGEFPKLCLADNGLWASGVLRWGTTATVTPIAVCVCSSCENCEGFLSAGNFFLTLDLNRNAFDCGVQNSEYEAISVLEEAKMRSDAALLLVQPDRGSALKK